MKEATGELSGTVITVVAIAAVAAIFTVIVLPIIRNAITTRTQCASAFCDCPSTEKSCTCTYYDEHNAEHHPVCDNPNYVE